MMADAQLFPMMEVIRSAEHDGSRRLMIFSVEQNANLAMRIADRVYLLETGHIVASGDAETIAADDSIRKAYLGY